MAPLKDLDIQLRHQFNLNHRTIRFDKKMVCHTFPFSSDIGTYHFLTKSRDEDLAHLMLHNPENKIFRYAVFHPEGDASSKGPIVLLHGLNERSWDKYLIWAYNLADFSKRPVVLFPLANHINRSPRMWTLPRKMAEVVDKRNHFYGKIPNSSFINAALSSRIDQHPEVFVGSGLQSISDVVKLASFIYSGEHTLFPKGTTVDFFAYSIGALVTELLLMADPIDLFSLSKAFFFCGGATFDQMDGRSKNILDNRAFRTLKEFMDRTELFNLSSIVTGGLLPYGGAVLKSFSSLMSLKNWKEDYKSVLNLLSGRIKAVGLKLDKVIPGDAICKTLCMGGFSDNVSVADFEFKHSHEHPFPLQDPEVSGQVENAFKEIFMKAALFLNGV